jgi:membrane dipeptidase
MTFNNFFEKYFKHILICFLIFLSASKSHSQSNYLTLHQEALVVDLHNDAICRCFKGQNIERFSRRGHVDLVRLKQGGVDVQFFALWPDPRKYMPDGMFKHTTAMLDTLHQITKRNPDKIKIAKNPDQIRQIVKQGKIAACIGIEGGTAIENSLTKLDYFYRRGVRYLGLTWNDSPDWASSAKDESKLYWQGHRGLTDFGKNIVRRMNELGMMIDLSHAGEQTFYDVLEITTKPVIASHSCVYSICPHYRNLKDKQIRALAKNGGAVFINFYPGFLVKGFEKIYQRARKRATAIEDSLQSNQINEPFDRSAFIHQFIDPIYPRVSAIIDHIDYVVKLVGDDYVGLGSDFDGIMLTPAGLNDVSKMPAITRELVKRGYSEKSIKKILGGNFMRIFSKQFPKPTKQR